MIRASQISLLSSFIMKSLPFGHGLVDVQIENSNKPCLSHSSLVDHCETVNSSKHSLVSSKFYLDLSLDEKSQPISIGNIPKSSSNRNSNNSINDKMPFESSSNLEVPCSKVIRNGLDINDKNNKFKDKEHNFRRSKSWAKYHGSHLQNRPTRIHRRSRSDLGGLVLNPLSEFKTFIDVSDQDKYLRRFEFQQSNQIVLVLSAI